MDSRSTKDLSLSQSSESEDSELEGSRDAFGNVERYTHMSHLRVTLLESGENDDKEDTDTEERLNNTNWLV